MLMLTSSLVVRLEATKYVWKPERPRMDQMEKKQTTSSTTLRKGLRLNTDISCELFICETPHIEPCCI